MLELRIFMGAVLHNNSVRLVLFEEWEYFNPINLETKIILVQYFACAVIKRSSDIFSYPYNNQLVIKHQNKDILFTSFHIHFTCLRVRVYHKHLLIRQKIIQNIIHHHPLQYILNHPEPNDCIYPMQTILTIINL